MRRDPVRSFNATLKCSAIRSNQLSKIVCQECRVAVDTIQPNIQKPNEFLAICQKCGGWFRLEIRLGDSQGVMVRLPEITTLLPNGGVLPNPPVGT